MLDASRSVPVTTTLLSEDGREKFITENEDRHQKLRDNFNKKDKATFIRDAVRLALDSEG